MTMDRPAYYLDTSLPGSDVTAETASAFALGSLVFKNRGMSHLFKCVLDEKNKGIYGTKFDVINVIGRMSVWPVSIGLNLITCNQRNKHDIL